jgi:hypothetical protein
MGATKERGFANCFATAVRRSDSRRPERCTNDQNAAHLLPSLGKIAGGRMKFKRRLIIRAKRRVGRRSSSREPVSCGCRTCNRWLHTRGWKLEMSVFKLGGGRIPQRQSTECCYRCALQTAHTKVQAEEAEGAILLTVHSSTYWCE